MTITADDSCAGCMEYSAIAGHCHCNCDAKTCVDPAHDPQCDRLSLGNPTFRRCGCPPERCAFEAYEGEGL